MVNQHRVKYVYLFFWLFAIEVDTSIINDAMVNEDPNVVPVFFRWSHGFELNGPKDSLCYRSIVRRSFQSFSRSLPRNERYVHSCDIKDPCLRWPFYFECLEENIVRIWNMQFIRELLILPSTSNVLWIPIWLNIVFLSGTWKIA